MTINNVMTLLEEKKAELTHRVAAINRDFQKGRSADSAEQVTEAENDEVLAEIRHEAQLELTQITAAIQRIKDNQYGICTACDEPIAQARLNALPYIETCIACAK